MANTRKIAAVKSDESVVQEAEATREDFTFEVEGKTYSLPHASKVKSGVYRRIRNSEGMEGVYLLVESIATEEVLEVLDELTLEELGDVLNKWQEHAGATVGE
jgi:hypothetical protein